MSATHDMAGEMRHRCSSIETDMHPSNGYALSTTHPSQARPYPVTSNTNQHTPQHFHTLYKQAAATGVQPVPPSSPPSSATAAAHTPRLMLSSSPTSTTAVRLERVRTTKGSVTWGHEVWGVRCGVSADNKRSGVRAAGTGRCGKACVAWCVAHHLIVTGM